MEIAIEQDDIYAKSNSFMLMQLVGNEGDLGTMAFGIAKAHHEIDIGDANASEYIIKEMLPTLEVDEEITHYQANYAPIVNRGAAFIAQRTRRGMGNVYLCNPVTYLMFNDYHQHSKLKIDVCYNNLIPLNEIYVMYKGPTKLDGPFAYNSDGKLGWLNCWATYFYKIVIDESIVSWHIID